MEVSEKHPRKVAPRFIDGDPRSHEDLFDPKNVLDLTTLEGPAFNLVDGTVAIATDDDMPFVLFKGYNKDTWFYAPRWGRLARSSEGRPAFTVTKRVKNNRDGSQTTLGGTLSFMIELVVELPDGAAEEWTRLIETLYNLRPSAGAFNFQPLPMSHGKMQVFGLSRWAIEGQDFADIDVGASSSIAFAVELNPEGADFFFSLVGQGGIPQVAIMCNFKYEKYVPKCKIAAKGFKKVTYNYFSESVKARASYFGLVSGSYERQRVRADMKRLDGLNVEVIGEPPDGIDLQKLLDSIFDSFVKIEVGNWIDPASVKPADASAPGGYFGGVSYAMKDLHFTDTARFERKLEFAKIEQEIHQASFSFEQQIGQLDPATHAFLSQDDHKAAFEITASASEIVNRYVFNASYTTADGQSRQIQFDPIDAAAGGQATVGGKPGGVIQWPPGTQRPPSPQVLATIDFVPPNLGYQHVVTLPIKEYGVAFYFQPDAFVQRTTVYFTFALESSDPTAKALFQWRFEPGDTRPPIAQHTLIIPDPDGAAYNIPTVEVVFPFHPSDWKPDGSGPKVQFSIKGLSGEWLDKELKGKIGLFEPAVDLNWNRLQSISDVIDVPALTGGGWISSG